jgi:hypothetical protein
MITNIGVTDKIIRIVASILISAVIWINIFSGLTATIALIFLAFFLITTAFMGYCPIYNVFGVNTKKNLNDKAYSNFKKQFNYHN